MSRQCRADKDAQEREREAERNRLRGMADSLQAQIDHLHSLLPYHLDLAIENHPELGWLVEMRERS